VFPVLALGTWIVYVLDRLLDGLDRSKPSVRSDNSDRSVGSRVNRLHARHHFHRRHRRILLSLACAAALALACLCCDSLPRNLVYFYLALGLPVAAYALRVHAGLLSSRAPAPVHTGNHGSRKEAAVAIFFTIAVMAPAFEAAPPSMRFALVPTAVLLAGLCFFNCAFISHAEAPAPPGEDSIQQHQQQNQRQNEKQEQQQDENQDQRLSRGTLLLALLAAAGCAAAVARGGSEAAPDAAILLAALLLRSLLAMHRRHADPRRLRVLADLALLTPLLFLLVQAG
jgi:hypothetical protein